MILSDIIQKKTEEIEALKNTDRLRKWERIIPSLPKTKNFREALQQDPAIIAEIKRTSPSLA